MSIIHVGVLRGGPSSEYEVSLNTGRTVLTHMPPEKYKAHDIFIDKEGQWHMHGISGEPHQLVKKVDVVFNALHGEYGEDGKVQQFLEMLGVPFTGSGALASAVGMNKVLSKKIFLANRLKTPHYMTLHRDEVDHDRIVQVYRTFPMPAVVKPVSAGSSVGVTIARTIHELEEGIVLALEYGDTVLLEEFIKGVEATCGVVERFRNEDLHALMPIEIRPKKSHFFDYHSKYTEGGSEEICPGNFTRGEIAELESLARTAHRLLNLRHYSRSDFIVTPRRGIYILEVNTQPGLTETSLVPKSLQAGGTPLSHFIEHIIELALGKK
jgi:D-alanine-D-alanine ligase